MGCFDTAKSDPRPSPRPLDLSHASTNYATPIRPTPRLHDLRHAPSTYATPPRPSPRPYELRPASTTYATPIRPTPRPLDLSHASTTYATPIRPTPRPLDVSHASTTFATPIRPTPRPLDLSHASTTYATPIRHSPRPLDHSSAPFYPVEHLFWLGCVQLALWITFSGWAVSSYPVEPIFWLGCVQLPLGAPILVGLCPHSLVTPGFFPALRFLSLSQPIRGREIFVTSPEHVSQPVPANQVSAAECSMQSGSQAGRQTVVMTKPKRGHRCPICSKFLNNVSQHLRNIHRVKNSEERKILNDLASGFTAIPPGLCPEEGCSSKIGHVAKHLKRHKDISKSKMEELLETARRETAIKLLSNLRSPNQHLPAIAFTIRK
ncbi:hypothetical protein WMY93_029809 [Mugilogobius chulae]|uniref:C2H2-type domain-containing protein n=1 Tax=Mugilogobius chulae TaxID=88201 RepID=A0AAW0MM13_9GOBI